MIKEKNAYIIYNSLYELINHCIRYHDGILDKCIINYRLILPYIEVEVKKDLHRYIMHEDNLLRNDKIDYLKNKIKEGNIIIAVKVVLIVLSE